MKTALLAILFAATLTAQTGKSHPFRGKVTAVDATHNALTVQNEPVEGWMGAMTMGYPVSNPAVLATVHPGDDITATVYDGDTRLYEVAVVPRASAPAAVKGSLTLEELEAMTLAGHPAMAEAEAARRAATGMARQASLYPNPSVGYYGDEIRGGHTAGGKQGVFATQTIVLGGKLSAARRLGEREVDQASASLQLQKSRVLLEVRTAFYHALATQRLVELRQKQLAVAEDAAQTAHQLANTGIADQPDVLQSEIEQQQAELAMLTSRQELHYAWRAVAIAAGQPNLPEPTLQGDFDNLPVLIYEEAESQALRSGPEVRLAHAAITRAEAKQDYARRIPVPDLALSGTLAHNFEPLEITGRPTGLQGGAQIGVQIPLFNRNQGNIAAAGAEIQQARSALARRQLDVDRELTRLFRELEIARQVASKYQKEIIPRAAETYRLYQQNYQAMAGSYPPVLMAQRSLFQLETDLIRALESAWQNVLAIRSLTATLN